MKKEAKHLKLSSLPFDITSHPSLDLVAVSNIDGEITFLRCNGDDSGDNAGDSGVITALDTIKHHTDSCRRLLFSGSSLLSISSDKTLVQCDVDSRRVIRRFDNEHALYALCDVRNGNVFATGDDEGVSWEVLCGSR